MEAKAAFSDVLLEEQKAHSEALAAKNEEIEKLKADKAETSGVEGQSQGTEPTNYVQASDAAGREFFQLVRDHRREQKCSMRDAIRGCIIDHEEQYNKYRNSTQAHRVTVNQA